MPETNDTTIDDNSPIETNPFDVNFDFNSSIDSNSFDVNFDYPIQMTTEKDACLFSHLWEF